MKIDHRLYVWERGTHAGLVGDVLAEGRAREGRVKRSDKKEEDHLLRSFNSKLLSGNLQQAVRRATNREVGGVFSWGMSEKRLGKWF